MKIIKVDGAADIASEKLEDWGVPKTIGEQVCKLSGIILSENEDGSEAGIWECTPGKFVRIPADQYRLKRKEAFRCICDP